MKVAHIAFQYGLANTGGAAIAATRLHQALLARGVESHYICVHKREAGTNVHELPRGWRRGVFFVLTKITRCMWRFTPYRKPICLNVVPLFGIEKVLAKIKPDIVHVQWLNADVCSFEQLTKLPYRMIFNLHDLYMILPGGGYPGKDRRFIDGLTQMNSTWLERFLVRRKEQLIRKKASAFIGPSDWVCKMANESVIGSGIPAHAIPNIIDELFFEGLSRRGRNEKFIILFGAYGGRGNGYKGFSDLEKSLALLPGSIKCDCELRIFGESADTCEIQGVATGFLGDITDPVLLRQVYCAADIFVFPSVQETQGMTKVEAMLCGLPVIAFDRTACAEGIEHRRTGWIAPAGDYSAFANGIVHYYSEWRRGALTKVHEEVSRLAKNRFREELIVEQIVEVYRNVCKQV